MIGYTYRRNNPFYFDKEDYELVSRYYWKMDSEHNVITQTENGVLSMHKLIMGDGIYYHENGVHNDNRKFNLKPARGYRNNGKVKYNGYIAVYMPEHHRAFENGCVYEHILVAERMLERLLLPEEVVHHKDKDRTNNSEDNLMVFATDEDHALYHAGANAILQDNGSYKSERLYKVFYTYVNETKDCENKDSIKIIKKTVRKNLCPQCNTNYKTLNAELCLECYKSNQSENVPSKDELESLIGKIPFTRLGEKYGVTDNAVRKWCKKYGLPFRTKDLK